MEYIYIYMCIVSLKGMPGWNTYVSVHYSDLLLMWMRKRIYLLFPHTMNTNYNLHQKLYLFIDNHHPPIMTILKAYGTVRYNLNRTGYSALCIKNIMHTYLFKVIFSVFSQSFWQKPLQFTIHMKLWFTEKKTHFFLWYFMRG